MFVRHFLVSEQFWLPSSGCVLVTFFSHREKRTGRDTGEIYIGGIKTSHSWAPASFPLKERSDEYLGNGGRVFIRRLRFRCHNFAYISHTRHITKKLLQHYSDLLMADWTPRRRSLVLCRFSGPYETEIWFDFFFFSFKDALFIIFSPSGEWFVLETENQKLDCKNL